MKMNRNFRAFTDFMSLELEVPTICLVTGGVSGRRERRYSHKFVGANMIAGEVRRKLTKKISTCPYSIASKSSNHRHC
jgi:hypothetical protein